MLTPELFSRKFKGALEYPAYVATGRPDQQHNWNAVHARVRLSQAQHALLGSFRRSMNVLVISGVWCGDCVQQVPILDHIARAAAAGDDGPTVALRCLDRDRNLDLAEPLMICGGLRVPTVVWLNEDFEFVSVLGDRTLSRYRALAARNLGPSCPLPGAAPDPDELAATIQDWVNEFERVHLLLRLSPKLRERYAD